MSRSFPTRLFVHQCLGHLGPLVLYGALAVLSAWSSWHGGWPSAGGFWGAWFALFFGTIVCNEVRHCASIARAIHCTESLRQRPGHP
jgi:hypothetical protein